MTPVRFRASLPRSRVDGQRVVDQSGVSADAEDYHSDSGATDKALATLEKYMSGSTSLVTG
jgi:hypothetical protein